MADVIVDEWHKLYGSRWGDELTPGGVSHPAKFNRKLIQRIYQDAIEHGWLKAGDTVIDPFGGIALGALDAMRLGMRWIGIELEPRFVMLGNSNLDLWNYKYGGHLPGWGTARIIRGDSRNMAYLLAEYARADLVASSPSYVESKNQAGRSAKFYKTWAEQEGGRNTPYPSQAAEGAAVDDAANLGNMPAGSADGAIASPPFVESLSSGKLDIDTAMGMAERSNAKNKQHRSAEGIRRQAELKVKAAGQSYGSEPGQLGALPVGDADLAVSSPPFAGVVASSDKNFMTPSETNERNIPGRSNLAEYGNTPGQLGGMPVGDADLAVSSPPFLQVSGGAGVKPGVKPGSILADPRMLARHSAGNPTAKGYGHDSASLTNKPVGDLDAAIASPPYAKAPGHGGQSAAFDKMAAEKSIQHPSYGDSDGQLGALPVGEPDASISSPPFLDGREARRKQSSVAADQKLGGAKEHRKDAYGDSDGQIAAAPADTFWNAARDIVAQTYAALRPGGHAIWVTKGYVKGGKLVDFPGQWRRLCEAVGFITLHEHRAMVVEDNGTQKGMEGHADKRYTAEHKSFFRRDAEKKGAPRIDYETVLCMEKPE